MLLLTTVAEVIKINSANFSVVIGSISVLACDMMQSFFSCMSAVWQKNTHNLENIFLCMCTWISSRTYDYNKFIEKKNSREELLGNRWALTKLIFE